MSSFNCFSLLKIKLLEYRLRKQTKDSSQDIDFTSCTRAKVIDVYDGDTITVIVRYKNTYFKIKVRLHGIDTPEIRTKNPLEKEAGFIARDFLSSIILNQVVRFEYKGKEKFGRTLANIYPLTGEYKDKSVSDILIEKNMGVVYTGGTKEKF